MDQRVAGSHVHMHMSDLLACGASLCPPYFCQNKAFILTKPLPAGILANHACHTPPEFCHTPPEFWQIMHAVTCHNKHRIWKTIYFYNYILYRKTNCSHFY